MKRIVLLMVCLLGAQTAWAEKVALWRPRLESLSAGLLILVGLSNLVR